MRQLVISLLWLILLAAVGCGQPSRAPALNTAHRQTTDTLKMLVLVTDLASGQRVAELQTDEAGQLEFPLPPGKYAFAATSPHGFAFFDKEISNSDRLTMTLSSDCHRVSGRILGTIARPALVNITRISTFTGDSFLAGIADDETFDVCLPRGTYNARIEGSTTSLETSIALPSNSPITITGYPKSHVEGYPTTAYISAHDFIGFAKSLTNYRVIGLGEANHGTAEFYTYRGRLSKELARNGNLRSILLEADAIGMLQVEDYVMGRDIDIAKSIAGLRFWITDTHEFTDFLAEIRTYNSSVDYAQRIHVMGIDAQRIEPPAEYILAHRSTLSVSDHEASLLAKIAPDHGTAFSALSKDDHTAVTSLLDRLATVRRTRDVMSESVRGSIAARSIRYQLEYLQGGSFELRDRAMAELAAYIIEIIGAPQSAVWGHNAHIARQSQGGTKSLGQHLSDKFGANYLPIAFLSYRGSARAWDAAGKIGVLSHVLSSPPAYNIESVIMSATKFADSAWVRLDNANGPLSKWLAMPRYVREFGALYDPRNTQTLRNFPEAIAAVVVLQNASASTPTPTGVRMRKTSQ